MFKRMMIGVVAVGAIAVLATQASAACTWVKTSTGAYRLYGTCSVACDLAFQGGPPNSTIGCQVDLRAGTEIVLLCINKGGNIAPGGNINITDSATLFASRQVTADRKTGISSAVVKIDLVDSDELGQALDDACAAAFNGNTNWTAINAVPCDFLGIASNTGSNGNTEVFQDRCTLPVQQCDPQYTEVLDFNKKTGDFEKIFYQCTEEGHFQTN